MTEMNNERWYTHWDGGTDRNVRLGEIDVLVVVFVCFAVIWDRPRARDSSDGLPAGRDRMYTTDLWTFLSPQTRML